MKRIEYYLTKKKRIENHKCNDKIIGRDSVVFSKLKEAFFYGLWNKSSEFGIVRE